MEKDVKIVLLEDSNDDVNLIQRELKRAGIRADFAIAENRGQFEKALREFMPDIVLCDHTLPAFNSFEALDMVKLFREKHGKKLPFILVTGTISEEFASHCIIAGADDYLLKDRLTRLPDAVRSALDKARIENERQLYFDRILANEVVVKEAERLANFGTWKIKLDTGKTVWSDGMFRLCEYEPGEVEPTYEMFLEHVLPDDAGRVKASIDKVMRAGVPSELEYRIIDKEGQIKHIYSRFALKIDEGGHDELVGFGVDITNRKQAEDRLVETCNLASIGGWETDLINGKLTWTEVTRRIHEVDADFMPDPSTAINFYKEGASRNAINQAVTFGMEKETNWDLELQIVTAKGKERWVRAIGKTEVINGVCVRVYGSFQDIDDRKKAQLDLEMKNQKLEEIASIQSHKVRGPLARLMGLVNLLIENKDGESSQAEIFEKVRESADELDTVIRKVVGISG